MAKRHHDEMQADETGAIEGFGAVPVPETAHTNTEAPEADVSDEPPPAGPGRAPARQFEPAEAYRRISNILKRTPLEARQNVMAAVKTVLELG